MLANTVDPDQMPHHVASDLCLHCLPTTLLRVFLGKNEFTGTIIDLKKANGFYNSILSILFSVRKQVKSKQSQGQQPMSISMSQIQSYVGNKNKCLKLFVKKLHAPEI